MQSDSKRTPSVVDGVVVTEEDDGTDEVDLVRERDQNENQEVWNEPHLAGNESVFIG
jgi:hypothetical protein